GGALCNSHRCAGFVLLPGRNDLSGGGRRGHVSPVYQGSASRGQPRLGAILRGRSCLVGPAAVADAESNRLTCSPKHLTYARYAERVPPGRSQLALVPCRGPRAIL